MTWYTPRDIEAGASVVVLPGRKRIHLAAFIEAGVPLRRVWEADTTACGKRGPWMSAMGTLQATQDCRACWRALGPAAYDTAPADLRRRLGLDTEEPLPDMLDRGFE
jgi:hypothetical protein